jgi:hypothetical protein
LVALMRRPLLDVGVSGDDASDEQSASVDAPRELIVRTAAGDGSEETRFAIERHAGCLWLRQE